MHHAEEELHSIELQPLADSSTSSSAFLAGQPGSSQQHVRRTRCSRLVQACLAAPGAQRRLWITLGCLAVVVAAGVAFSARPSKQQQKGEQQQHAAAAGAAARAAGSRGPVQPFLAPTTRCTLDDVVLGPEVLLHRPLNYRVALNLSRPDYYQAGVVLGADDDGGGFEGATNLTLHILQNTSCLSLQARNLSFSSITASLLLGSWLRGDAQEEPQPGSSAVCLCGADSTCLTQQCGQLLRARPGPDTSSWVVSLGPLVAPAGSTLLLATTYTAAFQQRQGLWRSSPAASPGGGAQAGPTKGAGPGEQAVVLSTEFEMNAARAVLPCMDQPGLKATFVMEVLAPAGLTVLSNMPPASSSAVGGSQLVTFLPTPPMSTYLLSLVVGQLASVEANTTSGHLVRVWAAPDKVQAAAVPLRLAVAALQHYQAFTGISQSRAPATKWDLVAVPGKLGAVENWGLLLFDPERLLLPYQGAWALFRCADVICHELAHQWYGNWVTAATWPDLLVNEGLASLAEYGCLASVLQQQLGASGAALLMHHMAGTPAGWAPGVHEGVLGNTLGYDASPLAQPLLGSGLVEFAVPVYSKAASLMAMVAVYAALAAGDPEGPDSQGARQWGPVAGLTGATAQPGLLQVALRQHLRENAFGTATAADVLQRILGLAPQDVLAGNAVAVLTGWQNPGSPVLQVNTTQQGFVVQQRRFCSWGLLQDQLLQQVLASGPHAAHPQPLPAPSTASPVGASHSALLCPSAAEDRDRAVPWTPVLLRQLPAAVGSDSDGSEGNDAPPPGAACAAWHVLRQDSQQLLLPDGCQRPAAAGEEGDDKAPGSHMPPLYVLEGDGGWGVFRGLYPAQQRAAVRGWVVAELPLLLMRQQKPSQLLLMASKLLQDQAALGLSAFGEVPGGEVWAALEAAANATSRVLQLMQQQRQDKQQQRGAPQQQQEHAQGFGAALYALLAPLLPGVDVLLDRLAITWTCWLDRKRQLAALLHPVTEAALAAFAPAQWRAKGAASTGNGSSSSLHSTPDAFLGGMVLNRLLVAAALVEPAVARQLCQRFDQAVAAAGHKLRTGAPAADPDAVLSQLHPDMHHAVLSVVAAQPPGCQVQWTGAQLLAMLQEWLVSSRDPQVCTLAAFALAYLPARAAAAPTSWQHILELLLGLSSSSTPSGSSHHQQHGSSSQVPQAARACGVPPAVHAVETAVLLSRALALAQSSDMLRPQAGGTGAAAAAPSGSITSAVSHPVTAFLAARWQQVMAALGASTAWTLLREVAAREVLTLAQWQSLAVWVAEEAQQRAAVGSTTATSQQAQEQQRQYAAVLGAAWSTVLWSTHNQQTLCGGN